MHIVTTELGGRPLSIETGRMAKQAGGSALVRYGDTMVLVAATADPKPSTNLSFFPLAVYYTEKMYASGRIPGGFFRREGRPTETETLTSRFIDRPIRPLFPAGFHSETQVMAPHRIAYSEPSSSRPLDHKLSRRSRPGALSLPLRGIQAVRRMQGA